jgi:hypothetical protein
MIAVRNGAIIGVNIRDYRIDQALPKARTRFQIPIPVVGEDDDKRFYFTG